MKIAFVVNNFPVTSETFIFNKVMGLRRMPGFEVAVLTHGRRDDRRMFAAQLAAAKLDFVACSLTGYSRAQRPAALAALCAKSPLIAAQTLKHARTLYGDTLRAAQAWVMALPLKAGGFDAIHFEYSGLAVVYTDALPLLAPAKLVMSCRGAAEQIRAAIDENRAHGLRRVIPLMDKVHCVSADMLRTMSEYGVLAEQAFINHPSIDAAQFQRRTAYQPQANPPSRLVSTGRLHWKKGYEYALLAVRALIDEGFDVRYDIIGDGAEQEKLQYEIYALGLGGSVTLHGKQNAQVVKHLLESADIYVLPSLSEGLSNAALEAMAMEMPIVSTTAGGMEEAISNGSEGFLVQPREPYQLAARIKTLILNPDLRARMGRKGRSRIEMHFNLPRQLACFVDEYHKLIGGASASPFVSDLNGNAGQQYEQPCTLQS